MIRLNVRCCCQPTKILGTLALPDDLARKCSLRVMVDGQIEHIEIREISLSYIDHRVKEYARCPLPPETEYAVYSDDRPLEFWRNVPGFVEGDRA